MHLRQQRSYADIPIVDVVVLAPVHWDMGAVVHVFDLRDFHSLATR